MHQTQSFDHPSGALTRTISRHNNVVRVWDQTAKISETGNWLLGSGGVNPIYARPRITALLIELIEHGLKPQIDKVYVNPILGCSLILNWDIPFDKLPGATVSEDETELSFGRYNFNGTDVEVIVMRVQDLEERFQKGTVNIVVTDSQGNPLS